MANNLTASEIRARAQQYELKSVVKHIPEWDTDVILHELSGVQFVDVTEKSVDQAGAVSQAKFIIQTIIATLTDMDGERIFHPGDETMVSAGLVAALGEHIMSLNGMSAASASPKKG